ncbi:unnamed protein product [Trichobilharzia szidati]|nr:unnamed protein product [Trichobilharzia szidati]
MTTMFNRNLNFLLTNVLIIYKNPLSVLIPKYLEFHMKCIQTKLIEILYELLVKSLISPEYLIEEKKNSFKIGIFINIIITTTSSITRSYSSFIGL